MLARRRGDLQGAERVVACTGARLIAVACPNACHQTAPHWQCPNPPDMDRGKGDFPPLETNGRKNLASNERSFVPGRNVGAPSDGLAEQVGSDGLLYRSAALDRHGVERCEASMSTEETARGAIGPWAAAWPPPDWRFRKESPQAFCQSFSFRSTRAHESRTTLALGGVTEQFIGAPQERIPGGQLLGSTRGRIAGYQSAPTVLADNLPTEILDTDVQTSAAGRALLDKKDAVGHGESLLNGDILLNSVGPGVAILGQLQAGCKRGDRNSCGNVFLRRGAAPSRSDKATAFKRSALCSVPFHPESRTR